MNKSENCIVIHMKNDTRVAVTSPVSVAAASLLSQETHSLRWRGCVAGSSAHQSVEGRDHQWLQAQRSNHGQHEQESQEQIWRRLPNQTSHGRVVINCHCLTHRHQRPPVCADVDDDVMCRHQRVRATAASVVILVQCQHCQLFSFSAEKTCF